jgi:hypothetical protein
LWVVKVRHGDLGRAVWRCEDYLSRLTLWWE